ncbi:hypothetical protein M199_gp130 [Halogranum tailed virus 1]|uniref:Uncharacterized protein n=1 Tax=Halogranum tailed virus 1 TaxID=1273749 RepID=R4TGY0_9CAUD|nr:hypothetical protein M199_gp130 [Halogranum tailed virus 1]AGM11536.1 hypothetical protein HGTV1_239 [Halogranum tailed virus 1]
MNEQERLYAIGVLEQSPHEIDHIRATILKRRSSITFSDEDQPIGEKGKWMAFDTTLKDSLETLK